MIEILKNIYAEGELLYLKEFQAIILSDLHLGYSNNLKKHGLEIPTFLFNDIIKKLEQSLKKITLSYKIKKIIINGDLVHDFAKITIEEKYEIKRLFDLLKKYSTMDSVILIHGNHDSVLKKIINNIDYIDQKLEILAEIKLGEILILHGDKISKTKSEIIIIGHEHPAITLRSGPRIEKYKCFISGKYSSSQIIVIPSINALNEGTDILSEKLLSPYLKKCNIEQMNVFVVADKIYSFGKIIDLKNNNFLNNF